MELWKIYSEILSSPEDYFKVREETLSIVGEDPARTTFFYMAQRSTVWPY